MTVYYTPDIQFQVVRFLGSTINKGDIIMDGVNPESRTPPIKELIFLQVKRVEKFKLVWMEKEGASTIFLWSIVDPKNRTT
jgi:hypothetical protein